jgi:hypothetical protein
MGPVAYSVLCSADVLRFYHQCKESERMRQTLVCASISMLADSVCCQRIGVCFILQSIRHRVYMNWNILSYFHSYSCVFYSGRRESVNKKYKVSRAAYRARASAFERAPSDITTKREVCQGHAHCMLLCYWLTNNQNRFRHVSLGL